MKRFLPYMVIILFMAYGSPCSAHEGRPVYLQLTQHKAAEYLLQWKIPPVMPDNEIPKIHLKGGGCTLVAGENTARLTGKKKFRCSSGSPDLSLHLMYPLVNPGLSTLLVFSRVDGTVFEVFSGPERQVIDLPNRKSFLRIARQYVVSGIKHILAGYDHLLFVLCLLVIAGTTRRMLVTVTGFTLAHSVTLALASFDILQLSVPLVETLIALSIALLAAEIIKNNRNTLAWRYPVSMAIVFGLLHGFGFASALGELNLPGTMKLNALVFFNIGVEIGQILFSLGILVLGISFQTAMKISRLQSSQITRAGIYLVGMLSAYWLFERGSNIFV